MTAAASCQPGIHTPGIRGLSFVAPPQPFRQNPMKAVSAVNANWIAVIPYAYSRKGVPVVITSDRQWWGERPEGVEATIKQAHQAGLRVMLKPQIWIPGSWPGALDFEQKDWQKWEAGYEAYIFTFVNMAAEYNVALFCIGTELRHSVQERPQFWHQLIVKIRKVYGGKLVYAANWDDYEEVPFWKSLDFVGVNAYFPLINQKNPTVKTLKTAWQPWKTALADFHKRVNKPILFTEFGYLSVPGTTWNNWELKTALGQMPVDEAAQKTALQSLFSTFWKEAWWQGGFLWKWFPEMKGHEGYPEKDYTPQGKAAESTLRYWYGRH